jgi:hypothetical protein
MNVIRITSAHEINVFDYAVIMEIIVCEEEKMIAVKHLNVTYFNKLLCALQVDYSNRDTQLLPLSSLYCHGTL